MQKEKYTLSAEERRKGKRLRMIFILQVLMGILLALFTPKNILTYTWAQTWVEIILGNIFPKLLDVPTFSPIPQVVMFYHATMLAVLPVQVLALCYVHFCHESRKTYLDPNPVWLNQIGSRMTLIGGFFGALIFCVPILWLLHDGYGVGQNFFPLSKYSVLMCGSRFSLTVGAFFMPWTGLLLLFLPIISFPIFLIYLYPHLPLFRKNKKK